MELDCYVNERGGLHTHVFDGLNLFVVVVHVFPVFFEMKFVTHVCFFETVSNANPGKICFEYVPLISV